MKILGKFSRVPFKTAILQKELLARCGSHLWPIYLVNEYPKCGGTWLRFMLAEALSRPAWTKGKPAWSSCVMQAHWLRQRGRCRTVALFRDGRDVMVSFYFHSLFRNEFQNGPLVRLMRQRLAYTDYEDIRSNLLHFMQTMLESPVSPGFSWKQFVNEWAAKPGVVLSRYEDLRADTSAELTRLVRALTGSDLDSATADAIVERFSMQNMRMNKSALNPGMTGRQKAVKSFFRQGKVGGWNEYFTDNALAWLDENHAVELTALGYSLGRPNET